MSVLLVVAALMVGTSQTVSASSPADGSTISAVAVESADSPDDAGGDLTDAEFQAPDGDLTDAEFQAPATSSAYVAADSPGEAQELLNGLAAGGFAKVAVSYGPCTLYPSPIRIRSDGKVGTKPQTKCSAPVTSIRHSTDMRYKSFIWWRLKGTRKAGNQGRASLQQKNVGFSCVSDERSGWGSTTLGTIVYGGRTYYARVYPARVSLNCGG